MKIGITGHTSGIGKALHDIFPAALVFSRSNGYDITLKSSRDEILSKVLDCDVFINNANSGFAQQYLLYELWEQWKNKDKLIVNMSSRAADFAHNKEFLNYPYAIEKQALESACRYMMHCMKPCKVMCIKPGYVDTPPVRHVREPKIDPAELADYIKSLIESRYSSFWVPIITITPR